MSKLRLVKDSSGEPKHGNTPFTPAPVLGEGSQEVPSPSPDDPFLSVLEDLIAEMTAAAERMERMARRLRP
jgi:hypothetical protein